MHGKDRHSHDSSQEKPGPAGEKTEQSKQAAKKFRAGEQGSPKNRRLKTQHIHEFDGAGKPLATKQPEKFLDAMR